MQFADYVSARTIIKQASTLDLLAMEQLTKAPTIRTIIASELSTRQPVIYDSTTVFKRSIELTNRENKLLAGIQRTMSKLYTPRSK
jgi:hypothetical protein